MTIQNIISKTKRVYCQVGVICEDDEIFYTSTYAQRRLVYDDEYFIEILVKEVEIKMPANKLVVSTFIDTDAGTFISPPLNNIDLTSAGSTVCIWDFTGQFSIKEQEYCEGLKKITPTKKRTKYEN